jgi:cytochrome c-type biogenesis protein CcmH/NrfG
MAAVAKHQAGLHREAEAMYRQVLERDRHHPDALHLLGLLAHETGDSHNGVELIRRAIQESEKASLWPVLSVTSGILRRCDELTVSLHVRC